MLERLLNRITLWMQKKAEVARFRDIILADFQRKSPHFRATLLASLQFIYDHDPARFTRIQRHIRWIVNCGLELGKSGEYNAKTRTCSIDFYEPEPGDETNNQTWQTWHIARNAKILIHEATHGVLISRGIEYTSQSRDRVERLCVTEENRFVRRVLARARGCAQSELVTVMECLQSNFDPSVWEVAWTASRWQRTLSVLRRMRLP